MKLSEAILLGSSLLVPESGHLFRVGLDGIERGCALGMACKAISHPISEYSTMPDVYEVWPWTMKPLKNVNVSCCERLGHCTIGQGIAHIFDIHVSNGEWSLEQLSEWVASIEPATPETIEGRDPIRTDQETAVVENKV